MNLSRALVVIGCLVPFAAGHAQKHNFVGNTMWSFGKSGVFVFSPDGSKQHSHVPAEAVCEEPAGSDGGWSSSVCRFYDIVSDGKKYVWAAAERGQSMVDVFDIDTGAVVGSFEACLSPNNLEYHPLRDEVWVRCSEIDVNSTIPTHLHVFSASNPSGEIQTNILMQERALQEGLSSSGASVINDDLGDVGYLTDSSQPYLFKMDLSTKTIIDKIEMVPASHGLYEAVYSEVNNHIFVHAQMCCTCGSEDSDLESCGRSGTGYSVSPTTGSSAGKTDVNGVCGSSCEGIEGVDTIGVYEFDTKTGTVVATHLLAEGIGADPYTSPNGKYIVLLGKNGGKTIRVLEAGSGSSPSKTLIDLELDFNRTGYETKSVGKDFSFVERDGKTLFVMPSGTEHKVAIVDFTDSKFKTTYVTISDKEFVNGAPHGRYRQVEWAVGTDYVWTNDSTNDELYVIDVIQGKLVKTISEIESTRLVAVQNFERVRLHDDVLQAMNMTQKGSGSPDSLTVAAIIIGSLALFVGLVNLYFTSSMKGTEENEKLIAVPKHVIDDMNDVEPSLASVN